MRETIPKLYETEKVPFEKKVIYQRYEIRELGFYWLIAELDEREHLAFGYANLNDDFCAEWGYIHIDEILENGAKLDEEWKACTYKDAQGKIAQEKAKARFFRRYFQSYRS